MMLSIQYVLKIRVCNNSNDMNIHQITDLHIPDENVTEEQYLHVRENVRRQLDYTNKTKPDLLVVSGDLTMNDACESGCLWLRDQLPDIPVIVIPGNHDEPEMIKRLFGEWPWRQDYEDCSIVFLDTSPDLMSKEDMSNLQAAESEAPCILFMHHPPHRIGTGFMTINQPLLNCDESAAAISNSIVEHVFCGHYHNEAEILCDKFMLYLTPSPAFQISLNQAQFSMESFVPSVRTIHVCENQVTSELVFV